LRAGLVKELENLDCYPWCGHAVLLGQKSFAGQAIDEILTLFGKRKKDSRNAYRLFLSEGIAMGKRPELVGGGLHRSQMLESNGAVMGDYDERVLGGGDFVASLREEPRFGDKLSRTMDLNSLQVCVSDYFKLPAAAVLRHSRRNQYSEARELFCYLAVRELGYSGTKVGALIGMGTPSVSRSVRRGEELITVRPELKDWWITELKQ
jgi:hypothetical protein